MFGPDDGVGAFHAENKAEGLGGSVGVLLPDTHVCVECLGVADHADLVLRFEHAVVGELALRAAVRDFLVRGVLGIRSRMGGAGDDGDDGEEDFAFAHFGQGGGATAATRFGDIAFGLVRAQRKIFQVEVAVAVDGVHREV